jgi:hypothetical protein
MGAEGGVDETSSPEGGVGVCEHWIA